MSEILGEAKKRRGGSRRSKLTPAGVAKKKAAVLEMLGDHLSFGSAAARVGVDRRQLYAWRQDDAEFEAACEAARQQAVDELEASIYERALNRKDPETGKRPTGNHESALLSMYLHKGFRPEFKDSYRPEVAVREVRFTFEIPKPAGLGQPAELPEHVIEGEVISSE